jgi:hypothetical protein
VQASRLIIAASPRKHPRCISSATLPSTSSACLLGRAQCLFEQCSGAVVVAFLPGGSPLDDQLADAIGKISRRAHTDIIARAAWLWCAVKGVTRQGRRMSRLSAAVRFCSSVSSDCLTDLASCRQASAAAKVGNVLRIGLRSRTTRPGATAGRRRRVSKRASTCIPTSREVGTCCIMGSVRSTSGETRRAPVRRPFRIGSGRCDR